MISRSFRDKVSDDGFWFAVFHPFVCPACGGEGDCGNYDFYDSCRFCDGAGTVGLWAKILTLNDWFLDGIFSNIRNARYQRTHKETP